MYIVLKCIFNHKRLPYHDILKQKIVSFCSTAIFYCVQFPFSYFLFQNIYNIYVFSSRQIATDSRCWAHANCGKLMTNKTFQISAKDSHSTTTQHSLVRGRSRKYGTPSSEMRSKTEPSKKSSSTGATTMEMDGQMILKIKRVVIP